LAAFRFFKRERARAIPNYRPAVSVLKPVRVWTSAPTRISQVFAGRITGLRDFVAVNDDADPAVPVIRQIIADFPDRRIRLLIGAEHLGTNRKVNKLARLAFEAQNNVLVLTDGDVRVGPHFLQEVVAPLVDPEIGAVTCFYRGIARKI